MDFDIRRERTRRRHITSLKREFDSIFIFSVFPKVGHIDIEIAQNLSDLIIERAISKSIIQIDNSKSLSDIYYMDYDEEEFEKHYHQHRL